MNAQTAKITPKWEARPAAEDGAIVVVYTLHGTHRATTYDQSTANLIVDAGNTLSATGLTPRQLADQRAELLRELQHAVSQMEIAANCLEKGMNDEALLHVSSLMRPKKAAIARATGEQP